MYKVILNNEIDKLKLAGLNFNIEPGKFNLIDMQEISANKSFIDLADSILIVKKVQFIFKTTDCDLTKKFLKLVSEKENIDYSNVIDVSISNNITIVSSEFASKHETRLLMSYDLTDFIVNASASIISASLEYVKINRTN